MSISLEYKCPICGTTLGFEGLCWKCRAEQERQEVLAWTMEQITEKQQALIQNIKALVKFKDPETKDFWNLLSYHNAITPEIQQEALNKRVYYPAEIYYHAPADVRDMLIAALLESSDPIEASSLMSCLAMQGDDKALEVLLELERNPRPWREKLYVDPSVYAECGGWTFDEQGHRQVLNFDTCYPMVKGDHGEKSPVRIAYSRADTCPHCGCKMVDILVLDGKDERLNFLEIDGILTATCCPNCVCYTEVAFNRFTLDGGSEVLAADLELGEVENYISEEEYRALCSNTFVLSKRPVPLFYGAYYEGINTIGGFGNWVQDWNYTKCPDCGKTMKYVAQIQWDTVLDSIEGTLYIEVCSDCHIVSMHHQQT